MLLAKEEESVAVDFLVAIRTVLMNQGSSWQLGRAAIEANVMEVAVKSISHPSARMRAAGSGLLHSLLMQEPLFQDCQRIALSHGVIPPLLQCLPESM